MTSPPLTCHRLRRQLARASVRHSLLHGPAAPIPLVWVLGLGALAVISADPPLAVAWSLLSASLCALAVRSHVRRPHLQRLVLRSIAARRYPSDSILEQDTTRAAGKSLDLFAELACKPLQLHSSRSADADLDRALVDAGALLALQIQSALHAQELDRLARLTGSLTAGPATPEDDVGGSTALLSQDAAQARRVAIRVVDQLRELLLHVAQLELTAADFVRTATVSQRSGETLERLRLVVRTRREAGEEAMRVLNPSTRERN